MSEMLIYYVQYENIYTLQIIFTLANNSLLDENKPKISEFRQCIFILILGKALAAQRVIEASDKSSYCTNIYGVRQ